MLTYLLIYILIGMIWAEACQLAHKKYKVEKSFTIWTYLIIVIPWPLVMIVGFYKQLAR